MGSVGCGRFQVQTRRSAWWSFGAKVAGLGCAALAVRLVVASLDTGREAVHSDWPTALLFALSTLIVVLFSAALFWIAWRLWRRWSAATARLATGVTVALLALYVHILIQKMTDARIPWVGHAAETPILVLTAMAYRKMSRAVIRWSELEDVLDVYGQPAGHMARAKVFCVMLGISAWLSGSHIAHAMNWDGVRGPGGVIGLVVPVALGWLLYQVTLWRMTPRTRPALPPGQGFDVLPVEQKT
jgi:hypothetical protein